MDFTNGKTPLDFLTGHAAKPCQGGDADETTASTNIKSEQAGPTVPAPALESGGSPQPAADATTGDVEIAEGISLSALFQPRVGRHAILNDQVIAEFCTALKSSIYLETAAVIAGLSFNSLRAWLKQGKVVHEYLWDAVTTYSHDTEYSREHLQAAIDKLTEADWMVYKLYTETKLAMAMGEVEDLTYIAAARAKDWKAAKYRLTIRNREAYGENPTPSVQINTGDTNNSFTVINYDDFVNSDTEDAIEVEAETENPMDESRTKDV